MPWAKMGWHVASVVLVLIVWQLIGHSFGALFVPFSTTIHTAWDELTNGPLLPAIEDSGKVYLATLGVSIVLGGIAGIAIARSQWISDGFEVNLYILYTIPTISLVPFVFAAFGYAFWPQVAIAVVITIFPIIIGTTEGARSVPHDLIDVARSYGSSEPQLWRDVIVPYVVPHIMTGVKQAIPLALVGTLVAQFFLNATGVAGLLLQYSSNIQTDEVLAITLLISIMAVILVGIGEVIERVLTRWR